MRLSYLIELASKEQYADYRAETPLGYRVSSSIRMPLASGLYIQMNLLSTQGNLQSLLFKDRQ